MSNYKELIKSLVGENNVRQIRSIINKYYINKLSKIELEEYDKEKYPFGINLIGSFSQDSGLGQSCRLVAKLIEKADIPHSFIDFTLNDELVGNNKEFHNKLSNEYKYGINLLHINMHEFDRSFLKMGKDKFDYHYNIAYWLWEMNEFPEEWIPLINVLDEIWTPSEFVSEAIRKVTDKPVRTIPYLVEAPYEDKYDRKYFELPEDKFLYLMLFDSNSISERKNPKGVVKAFKEAFPNKDQEVGLAIKIGNAKEKELEELKKELEGYNTYFIDSRLSKVEVNSLVRDVDVYVSLHRAEGYGLVLAEAMLLGTPTVATNYSANIEFQNKENSCLVDYKLIKVGKDIYPYKKEYLWADPDITQASEYMKRLYIDKDFYNSILEKCKEGNNQEIQLSNRIKERLKEI